MKLLFVCTGNICRSPTAESVFRARAADLSDVAADSAGLDAYHVGEPPDYRAQDCARRRGYDLGGQKARRLRVDDFQEFDLILAMDRGHLRSMLRMAPKASHDRIRLFLDYAPQTGQRDVPDPWYGGPADFERMLDLVEAGVDGLVTTLRG